MNPSMFRSIREISVSFALGALSTATAVHAQLSGPVVVYTDAHAPAGGDGRSWSNAFRDLQDALAAAAADPNRTSRGVEVRIAQGVYTPDRATGNRAMAFVLNSAVTLMGGFAGLLGASPDERNPNRFVSVLSGDLAHNDGPNFANYQENSRTIVDATDGDSTTIIDGLEISGGNADGDPGWFLYPDGVITTIRSQYSSPTKNGTLAIRDCAVIRNKARLHPIIWLVGGTALRSRFEDNFVESRWIIISNATTFAKCRVCGNNAISSNNSYGNGIVFAEHRIDSPPGVNSFFTCLFADNVSASWGVITLDGSGTLMNCTVAHNSSSRTPAIFALSTPANYKVQGCIIAQNSIAGVLGWQVSIPYSNLDLIGWTLIDNGLAGIGPSSYLPNQILSGDPLFASLAGPDGDPSTWQDNDYRLRPGSPAIDLANASDLVFAYGYTDLNGSPLHDDPNTPNRGFGFNPFADLGCYEFNGQLCLADFNASGSLTTADIFDFLTAWFAADPRADVNGSGLSVSDIFDFLNAWFRGC